MPHSGSRAAHEAFTLCASHFDQRAFGRDRSLCFDGAMECGAGCAAIAGDLAQNGGLELVVGNSLTGTLAIFAGTANGLIETDAIPSAPNSS